MSMDKETDRLFRALDRVENKVLMSEMSKDEMISKLENQIRNIRIGIERIDRSLRAHDGHDTINTTETNSLARFIRGRIAELLEEIEE